MFTTIELPHRRELNAKDVDNVPGIYRIIWGGMSDDLVYYDGHSEFIHFLQPWQMVPNEIKDLFNAEDVKTKSDPVAPSGKVVVSESFILKAMAIAKGRINTTNVEDI